MELAGDALPGDLEALRALALRLQQELVETGKVAADLEAERDALTCERDALALDNERLAEINARLEHYLARLRRLTFGRRSEQMDPDQLQLALEDTEQAIAEAQQQHQQLCLDCKLVFLLTLFFFLKVQKDLLMLF